MVSSRPECDKLSEPPPPPEPPVGLSPDDTESDSEVPVEELLPGSEGSAPAPPDVNPPTAGSLI